MSSEISTSKVRLKPDTTEGDPGLQPWQFFVLAALGCATAVTFMARGQGPTVIVLLGLLMGAAALVGYAALLTLRPLVTAEEDRTVMVGQRTRVALEREKLLTLRSIKELEFDRAMGRLSDEDWKEMSGRLRSRVARLMKQLDAGTGYREQIERDLDARLKGSRSEDAGADKRGAKALADREDSADREDRADREERSAKALAERVCASCSTANDSDARFCKGCGQPLEAR